MVSDVSGNDVGTGSHRKGIVAGDPASLPGIFRQIAEKAQGGEANFAKLFHMTGPREIISLSVLNGNFLIKARQRTVKTTREP